MRKAPSTARVPHEGSARFWKVLGFVRGAVDGGDDDEEHNGDEGGHVAHDLLEHHHEERHPRVVARHLHRAEDQGLNSVTATLLLLMGEEDAFWSLSQLITERLPAEFYGRTL